MKRYQGIPKLRNINPIAGPLRVPYYSTVRYPDIPSDPNDIWVVTEWGDRLDLLANQFYGDISLYWVIATTNPNYVNFGSIYITKGTQIRIPQNLNEILASYNEINNI